MSKNKKVLMVMPHMVGGGAERVAAQIINKLNERGYDTRFILTSAKKNEVVRSDLNEKTELILLTEEMKAETTGQKLAHLPARAYSTIFGKLYEKQNRVVPASVGKATIEWQYHREIAWMRKYMQDNPDMAVIVFLQPSIPIVLLAAQDLPNKVIISERADPNRLMKKRYGKLFIEKYYTRANAAVFQTKDAKSVYPEAISKKGIVIFNPLKDNLPQPYHGERNKNITTFCRISNQKNLPVLVDAFAKVFKKHPDYSLRVIGDAPNDEGKAVMDILNRKISEYNLTKAIAFEPFKKNVHEAILKDAMYVNSSDYEGISNAMLEAMAIGMPVVCTDCPIGGAKATITDGENGLLVPIQNAEALENAINRVVEDIELANKLSHNSSKIRNELSLDKITEKWIESLEL